MARMFTYRIILYFSLVNISYLAFEVFRRGRGNVLYALEILLFAGYPASVLYTDTARPIDALLSVVLLTVSLLLPLAVSSSFAKAVFYRKFQILPRLSLIRALFVPTFENIHAVRAAFWLRADIQAGPDSVLSAFTSRISLPGTGDSVIRAARQLYSSYLLGEGRFADAAATYDLTAGVTPDFHEMANRVRLFLEAGRYTEALENLFALAAIAETAPASGDPMIYAAIPTAVFSADPAVLDRLLSTAGRSISWLPEESFVAWRLLAEGLSGNLEDGVVGLKRLAARLGARGKNECAASMLLRANLLEDGFIRPIPEGLRRMFAAPLAMWLDSRNRETASEKPTFAKSPAVKLLAAACVVGFVVSEIMGATDDTYLLTRLGANVGFLASLGEWHRWLTCAYLHGGAGHLAMNVLFLSVMGPPVEWAIGSMGFLFLYTYTAITGSIANNLAGSTVSVGSSGALMGLLGAAIVLKLSERRRGGDTDGQLAPLLYTLFAIALVGAAERVVDNWGHAGGFIGGLAAAFVLIRVRRKALADGFATGVVPEPSARAADIPATRFLGLLAAGVTLLSLYLAVDSYAHGGYPRLLPEMVSFRTDMGTLRLPSNWSALEDSKGAFTDRLRVVLRVLPMLITGQNGDVFEEYSNQTDEFFGSARSDGLVLAGSASLDGAGPAGKFAARSWTFKRPGGSIETAVDFLLLERTPAAIFHFQLTGTTVEPEFRSLFQKICVESTIDRPKKRDNDLEDSAIIGE